MLERITAIDERIRTYIPETSLVGVVMRSFSSYTAVKSENKLFLQHDIFSWYVNGKEFETVEETSRTSRIFDSAMNETIENLTDTQFRIIINALFDSMEDAGIHNVQDIADNTGRFSEQAESGSRFPDSGDSSDNSGEQDPGRYWHSSKRSHGDRYCTCRYPCSGRSRRSAAGPDP